MKRDLASLIAAACIVMPLGACGQKGSLYLPGEPGETQTGIPPQPSAPDSDSDSDSEARDERTDTADQ